MPALIDYYFSSSYTSGYLISDYIYRLVGVFICICFPHPFQYNIHVGSTGKYIYSGYTHSASILLLLL